MVVALEDALAPPTTVILDGDPDVCRDWQAALEKEYRPAVLVVNGGGGALPPALAKGPAPATGAAAWVCRGAQCLPPVSTPAALLALLVD
jgi:hypothetical protein